MNIIDELNKLKLEKDVFKEKKAQAIGKLEALKSQLKDLGCNSIEEANQMMHKLNNQLAKDNEILLEGINELKEMLHDE